MFNRFTDRARKTMGYSRQECLRFNHDYIGPEHILLGLILEGSGIASDALKNLDVDPNRLRQETERRMTCGSTMVTMRQIPFTPGAKKVLELALEEAHSLGHNYIGTAHLLLGLIREEKGIAAQVLRAHGLSIEEARDEVCDLAERWQRASLADERRAEEDREEPGPLDARSRRVMDIASREAQRAGQDRIGTEHILLGIVAEDVAEGVLSALLLERLRLDVEKLMARGTEQVAPAPDSMTPGARSALDLAFQAAGRLGAVKVSPRHLLLGLIREGEGVAAQVLAAAGITAEEVQLWGAADRSRKAMALARQEAQRFGHDCIDTEHALLGLLAADGAAAATLGRLGVDAARLRAEVEKRMTRGNAEALTGQLPFTHAMKTALELALEEARSGAIREEHLLLALIRVRGTTAQALAACGVTLKAVRRSLGPPAPPE